MEQARHATTLRCELWSLGVTTNLSGTAPRAWVPPTLPPHHVYHQHHHHQHSYEFDRAQRGLVNTCMTLGGEVTDGRAPPGACRPAAAVERWATMLSEVFVTSLAGKRRPGCPTERSGRPHLLLEQPGTDGGVRPTWGQKEATWACGHFV